MYWHLIQHIHGTKGIDSLNISLLQNLAIKELPTFPAANSSEKSPITFVQLKSRLMNLLINALQVETDPQNTHMLLGKLIKLRNYC